MKHSLALTLILCAAPGLCPADEEPLKLHVRSRVLTEPQSGRWHATTSLQEWNPEETAIVVCDMWDKHWCPTATSRVGEMAPVMNRVLSAARDRGVLIIHCPSGTMDFYADTPQRKLAMAAPKVETKVPLQNWCHLNKEVEGASLPIDDSDGGCDCDPPVDSYHAWTRQHPALEILEGDAITDSAEAFYLMKHKGIRNVIVMGVHTNMCVLGRPFSIRQMVAQGQNVVLMRDMTDTMYNPKMEPYVSHFTGTDLVVEHIERHWCPTVLSSDFLGRNEFRFRDDHRPHVVVLCAEREYRTNESLPRFAKEHLGKDYRVSFVWDDAEDRNSLKGIDIVGAADLLVVSVRRRTLPQAQLALVRKFVADGKPLVGIRTASHAFSLRNQRPPEGLDAWPEFDSQVFGGSYTNHHGQGPDTVVDVFPEARSHAVLKGIDVAQLVGHGSLYRVSPLADSTTPVLQGTIPGKSSEPVAWFHDRKDGGRSFYTSFGHEDDFSQPAFRGLLANAIGHLLSRQEN